jgi:hypothetical protein
MISMVLKSKKKEKGKLRLQHLTRSNTVKNVTSLQDPENGHPKEYFGNLTKTATHNFGDMTVSEIAKAVNVHKGKYSSPLAVGI